MNKRLEPYEEQALELIAKGVKLLYDKKNKNSVQNNKEVNLKNEKKDNDQK
ncbi:hypothetical protein [Paenibacillus sp. GM2]|uniref:hypothetical protein n=1 Tax=Paenibacillus sp. GM2 TaxID=1622070 RepID=UPI000A8E44A1|nr:hypothetical protein [Paenibacillus sp. GM2]